MIAFFNDENTSGYSGDDLAALNAAWDSLPVSAGDDGDIVQKSIRDHVAARLLAAYDRGLRDEALVAFCDTPDGAVAWKYADPTEDARWVLDADEAREIARQDPSLITWVAIHHAAD